MVQTNAGSNYAMRDIADAIMVRFLLSDTRSTFKQAAIVLEYVQTGKP